MRALNANLLTRLATASVAFVLIAGAVLIMALPAAAQAPLRYQLMCLRTPQECQGGGASSIAASQQVLATLQAVNARVNRAIAPRNDGAADVWTASAASGDCEDYVLAKRRALIGAGLPSSALRIAYVRTRQGVGHAVLVVKTGSGDLVLDNLVGSIRSLGQTGYRVVSMSGANPTSWS